MIGITTMCAVAKLQATTSSSINYNLKKLKNLKKGLHVSMNIKNIYKTKKDLPKHLFVKENTKF